MEDMGGNEKQPMKAPPENNNNPRQPPPPPQPPQQCPRCNSFNTKFCYYNNYSLSQPRYFCKSCRRYWTQGGTLRNVPVGGGCRKGAKRLIKGGHASGANSSSCSSSFIGECSRAQEQLPPPPPPPPLPPPPPALPPLPPRGFSNMGLPFPNSFYSPSGLLSSFAAMQNLNRPQRFNQVPLNGGGGHFSGIGSGSSSNLSLLQGFSGNNPNIMRAPPQVVLQQPIYRSPDAQMMVQQPNRPLGSWTQGFINNPSASNTNVSWAQSMLLQPNNNISPSEAAMNNPIQWPDHDVHEVDHLPGYGPPPPSS